MSDDERMDRARRIRQMREGRRSGEPDEESSDDEETQTVDGSPDEPADSSPDEQVRDDTDATKSDRAGESSNGEDPSVDGGATDAVAAVGSETDEPRPGESLVDESNGDEPVAGDVAAEDPSTDASAIEGPAAADEWFEDGDGEPTEAASSESEPTDSDGDTTETAAAAASAAAAFEVDEDEHQASAAATEASEDSEDAEEEAKQEAEIRVLEFRLGEEHYCLDIEYVEEIVKEESVTRVPNTPEHVHGVVDLRGQITTILDPKIALDIDHDGDEQLIVVFDADTFDDQGHAGWIVDEVRQVLPITESEVKESPLDRKSIKGVIERDEEFVIWTTPQVALEQAEE